MKIIDMEKRGGVFVPVKRGSDNNQRKGLFASPRRRINSRPPLPAHKILEGIVNDFFKIMRREMFK
jgi:hypothetical protein